MTARPAVQAKPVSKLAVPKAAAAAAGVGGDGTPSSGEVPEIDLSNQFSSANATVEEPEMPSAYMSAAVADEPEVGDIRASRMTKTLRESPSIR